MSKKSSANRIINIVLGVVVAVLVGYWLWGAFGVGEWLSIQAAVDDIAKGRRQAEARQDLRDAGNRQKVLEALKEALEEDGGTIAGKVNLLSTLSSFKETRTVRRAIDSKVLNTQRAAVWLRADDPAVRDRAREVTLAWIRDKGADSRHRAVILAGSSRLDLREAVPIILEILDQPARTQSEQELARHAIGTLRGFKPDGLAGKLIALARDTKGSDLIRGEALNALSALADAPVDEVRAMALEIVADKSASTLLRGKVTGVLRRPSYANEAVWDALEKVIKDDSESKAHWVTQRTCLATLGHTVPFDRLERLLLDKQVYRHPYWAVRVDVAVALAALDVKKRIALEVLCEYIADDDPDDAQRLVRQEAYLSYFVLTGISAGIEQNRELFRRAPPAIRDPEKVREYLWRRTFLRAGIQNTHADAVQALVQQDDKVANLRQTLIGLIPQAETDWKAKEAARKAAEEERKKKAAEKEEQADPEKEGPTPPEKEPGEEKPG